MNLVKWFRKNKTKVMAVVVIVIMFGFVGGSYISQLGQRRTGLHKTVAYLGDDRKITNYDLAMAGRELEILKMLRADALLRNVSLSLFRTQDLRALLLGELLFAEQTTSPELIAQIKQIIRTRDYRISDKQINDIYRRSMSNHIYWYCLKNEARQAGIRISNEDSGKALAGLIPQFFRGTTYSQRIRSIVNPPPGSNRQGIPEEEILTTFGQLLAVLEYAKMVCLSEDITSLQVMQTVSLEQERIDAEFVKFDSAVFAETSGQPSEEKIAEHFDKYKQFSASAVSEENPYGFGYKLPDRVQLEYIALKLDDISEIVTAPTQQETEEYYQRHREQFTEQVLSDANDPNSPLIERTKSYAEIASIISKGLLQNKINSKAERILQEAKALTEAGLQDIDTEFADISAEQFKAIAGDYENAAEQLSEKHKIKVYAGQTGMLSAADIQADEYLARLYLKGYGYNPVGLARIVFAIDELAASELGPFDVAKPRLYENIGPLKDILGQIMAIVRVKKAEKASEPESINQSYSTDTLRLEPTAEPKSEDIYSVKEKVTEDLKKLAAMDTTKSKAEEFIALAVKDGWEEAIDKFNKLYGQQDEQDESDPNVVEDPNTTESALETFKLENVTNLQRISKKTIETLAVQSEGNPAAQPLVNQAKKESLLIEQLYSLVPKDANSLDSVPLIIEFKPDMSCYCLKKICVKRIQQDEYEKIKALQAYKEDLVQSESLAAVHFDPENILKRMNFRAIKDE